MVWEMQSLSIKSSYAWVVTLFLLGIILLTGCSDRSESQQVTKLVKPDNKTLINNDFIVYYVNCGASEVNQVSEEDSMGLFQSVTDQKYTTDKVTESSWGYIEHDYMLAEGEEEELLSTNKKDTKWVIREGSDYVIGETGFYYDFELPEGEYEVTCGFFDPFSFRTIDIVSEGETVVEKEKLFKYKLVETAFSQTVTDGMLNIFVHNPDRGKDGMKNPILNYIIIRAVPDYDSEVLQILVDKITIPEEEKQNYSQSTVTSLDKVLEDAKELLKQKNASKEEIEATYKKVKGVNEMLIAIDIYSSFKPGNIWRDTEGTLIQAHGGQVQKLSVINKATGEVEEKWWWIGEDKTLGYRGGICAYSSDNLYNWNFEGVIMRNITSREQLDQEEYFTDLYKDYTSDQLDNVYRCINDTTAVIERPKMIYNEKTKQYVLWFHADGPTETSTADYAAASAGVAVSDSPTGPFRFIDRYRLNTCPEDQEDKFPESKGMARDMNLFVDDDTAYIIYSSEENLTMYISRLDEEYTYLDTPPEEAVNGVDFIRIFPGAQREAPAVFKRKGIYYMMTSGATGWDPNQARYWMAESLIGEWVNMGDPSIGDTKATTFDTQSTCIFAVDEEAGEYIYMGDRWNSEDLTNSRYIWLPLEFDNEGKMMLRWQEEWHFED